MGNGAIDRLDHAVGGFVDWTVLKHHERRLRKRGKDHQNNPPRDGSLWASGDFQPREGCDLKVLIDGHEAFGRMLEALDNAKSHVHVAGWHLTPDFDMARDETAKVHELLAGLSERVDVRVLLWAGAPAPLFIPSRRQVREIREQLIEGTRIQCALDPKERPLHCHHEKLLIIDDEIAFVGGLDLTDLAGDRYDTQDHPARGRLGWHDLAAELKGPAIYDVAVHFASRWKEITGEPCPDPEMPEPDGSHTVQVLRTVPEKIYDFLPGGDFSILEAYTRALRAAERFVYIENQFLWSPQIVKILSEKLRNPPSADFRVVALLPSSPKTGGEYTRGQLGLLADADDGNERFIASTICALSGDRVDRVYVHAKLCVVDDRWITLGSANLNEHSLFNDTEVNVACDDPELARSTRLRLWSEHLEMPIEEIDGEPCRVIDQHWRPISAEGRRRHQDDLPPIHRLRQLDPGSWRAAKLIGPLQGLVVDG